MGRLRVRGLSAVSQALLLRVAGWNLLRASRSKKLRSLLLAGAFCAETGQRYDILRWGRSRRPYSWR